jgi:hypothetical protein
MDPKRPYSASVGRIITCRALGLMRLAHSAEYILCAHTQRNTITFTYYATSIPRYDLRVVLRVPGEPTASVLECDAPDARAPIEPAN